MRIIRALNQSYSISAHGMIAALKCANMGWLDSIDMNASFHVNGISILYEYVYGVRNDRSLMAIFPGIFNIRAIKHSCFDKIQEHDHKFFV